MISLKWTWLWPIKFTSFQVYFVTLSTQFDMRQQIHVYTRVQLYKIGGLQLYTL